MTSLGNYASASVLKCNTLICNNTITSAYGLFKLESDRPTAAVIGNNDISGWIAFPSGSENKNISIDANKKIFSVAQAGLYKVDVNIQVGGDKIPFLNVYCEFKSLTMGGAIIDDQAGGSVIKNYSASFSTLLKIENPATDTFKIRGYVSNGVAPTWKSLYSIISIVKLA
jgi:hypothetical protein